MTAVESRAKAKSRTMLESKGARGVEEWSAVHGVPGTGTEIATDNNYFYGV